MAGRFLFVAACGLASAVTLACDDLIGLGDPAVADGGSGATMDLDAAMGLGDEPTGDAMASSDDGTSALDAEAFDVTLPLDGPDATLPPDVISEATMGGGEITTTGSDGSAPPPPLPPLVFLVNASPDLPSVRVCFFTTGIAPLQPIPTRPGPGQTAAGIDPWSGQPIPWGLPDPSNYAVAAYLVRASAIAPGLDGGPVDCVALLGSDGAGVPGGPVLGQDFWPLPTQPKGTYADGTVALVLFTGCVSDALDRNASPQRCGPDYDASAGNLGIRLFSFAPIATDPSLFGERVLQASSALDGVFSAQLDASVTENVAFVLSGEREGPLTFGGLTHWDKVPPYEQSVKIQVVSPDGAAVAEYPQTLSNVALRSGWPPDGGPYFTGESYDLVVVGDPSASIDAAASPHLIAFPEHLVPPVYP